MKNPLATKIALTLHESLSDSDSNIFETITLRPSEDVSAMIGTLTELLRQPVSTMFADGISEWLCEALLASRENHSFLIDLLDEPPQPGSALALLLRKEAIREA